MARYTTRIELHDADGEDYERLHTEMEKEGFSRLIKADDGTWYHLPWAEYNRETDLELAAVMASAESAAGLTGCTYEALVTKSDGRRWSGLRPVKK
jgi:hypothetical protein